MDNATIQNLLRVGRVSSIFDSKGTVKVIFEDKDEMVSNELPMLNFEYHMPQIGQQVLCIFLPNGINMGFCLGGFFSEVDPPPVSDRNIFCKTFKDGTEIKYDKKKKIMSVDVAGDIIVNAKGNILITTDGDFSINAKNIPVTASGNMSVNTNGSISVNSEGDIETIAGERNVDKGYANTSPVTYHP